MTRPPKSPAGLRGTLANWYQFELVIRKAQAALLQQQAADLLLQLDKARRWQHVLSPNDWQQHLATGRELPELGRRDLLRILRPRMTAAHWLNRQLDSEKRARKLLGV
jgi:hypothetical protein